MCRFCDFLATNSSLGRQVPGKPNFCGDRRFPCVAARATGDAQRARITPNGGNLKIMAWSYRQKQDDDIRTGEQGPITLPATQATQSLVDGAVAPDASFSVLTKATAGAYTLAAPTAEGQRLVITSGSAAAHVVTATGLLADGVTGGYKNTATFAAFIGATIMLIGFGGKWHTVSLKAVTVA